MLELTAKLSGTRCVFEARHTQAHLVNESPSCKENASALPLGAEHSFLATVTPPEMVVQDMRTQPCGFGCAFVS